MSKSSGAPADVKNINTVIPALNKQLNDPVLDWADQMLTVALQQVGKADVPPRDERVALISDIRREYQMAMDYRESYPVEATNSLTALVEICQKLQLDISEALVLKQLGDHYFYDMTRFRQAETCYSRAAWVFTAYDCTQSSAVVYDDYGTLNAWTGRYSAATDNYTQAARQWVLLSSQDSSGYRFRDMAGIEFMKAGEALRAAGETTKALEMMTAYGLDQLRTWAHASNSYGILITNLIKVADLFADNGNVARSVDLLQEAKRASQVLADPILLARTYEKLSSAYSAANQPANAQEALRKRESVLTEAASSGDVAMTTLEKSPSMPQKTRDPLLVKAEKGAWAYQALEDLKKSALAWRRLADASGKSGLVDRRISYLRSLAAVLDQQSIPQESLEVRREAATTAMKAGKKTLAAEIVQDMVQAFIDIGDLQNAIEGFTELVPIIEGAGNVRGAARVLEARGLLLAKHQQYDQAIKDLQDARIRYVTQVGDSWAAGDVALELASTQTSAKKIDEARNTLEAALEDIESKYAQENVDPGLDPKRSETLQSLYRDLASACVHQDKLDDARKLMLKAKRYLWLPDLIRSMNNGSDTAVASFAGSLDILGGDQITSPEDTPGKERLLADNWAAYTQTCWMLAKQYPSTYNALPVDPLDLFRSRATLSRIATVIEYMVTDSSVYVFTCSYGKPTCRELAVPRQDVDKTVAELRKALKSCEESLSAGIPIPAANDWRVSVFSDITRPLSSLYDALLAPVKPDLVDSQLLVFAVPSEFAGIPMQALVSPGSSDTPRFLIQDYGVSYLSRGTLSNLLSRDSKAIDPTSDRLAVFADPESNLKGAQEEAKAIRAVYINCQWYLGPRANASNFLKECENASILHIAAHYRIDPNPAKFEMMLASEGDSDGSITIDDLSDIENTHLDLVVLSACNSISSSDPVSSGPSKAAEVFSLAGAKSVMGGQWKVSDDAASKIMSDFYRSLNRGMSRYEALRRAQMSLINSAQFAHPFYWACFALYGNPW
ncbi:MAG: CHAT domain-containing protein [Armatimonadota bacterium]